MMDRQCAPILLIAFNRPDRLAAQIEVLRGVKPARLFVAIDGPRLKHPDDRDKVERTREAVRLIDWPCEIRTRFLQENRGCRFAPPEAISWMFEQVEEGIILEDDCVPTVDFLFFATEMLARYRTAETVGMITGNNCYGFQSNKKDSYRFSRHVHIWGWATWRRAWSFYDGSLQRYSSLVDQIMTQRRPNRFERYWRKYLRAVLDCPTTWDIQWCIAVRANDLLCVTPSVNLVANVGHEAGALHTSGFVYDVPYFTKTGSMAFPLRHPEFIECDEQADRLHARRSSGCLPRGITYLVSKLPFLQWLGVVWFARVVERLVPVLFRF